MGRSWQLALPCAALLVLVAPPEARAEEAHVPASDVARLRIGFDTSVGPVWSGRGSGFAVALRLRAGVHVGRYVGLTLQSTTFLLSDSGRVLTTSGSAYLLENGAMLHVTPVDALDLGVGAALDLGSAAGAPGGEVNRFAPDSRLLFGLTGRAALHIGRENPSTGRRVAFTLGVAPHLVFTPEAVVLVLTAGPGAEWY